MRLLDWLREQIPVDQPIFARSEEPSEPYRCPGCGKTHDDYGNPIRPRKVTGDLAAYQRGEADVCVVGEGFCRVCGGMLY